MESNEELHENAHAGPIRLALCRVACICQACGRIKDLPDPPNWIPKINFTLNPHSLQSCSIFCSVHCNETSHAEKGSADLRVPHGKAMRPGFSHMSPWKPSAYTNVRSSTELTAFERYPFITAGHKQLLTIGPVFDLFSSFEDMFLRFSPIWVLSR